MVIRKALINDIAEINKMYDEVNFPHSNFTDEFIAIAEINNQKVGLGRMINLDGENAELGGMYVLEKYRNKGIATKIIQFLLDNNHDFSNIFCLPFEKLKDYYGKFGFRSLKITNYSKIPKKILEKHKWCNGTYDEKVLLLALKKDIK